MQTRAIVAGSSVKRMTWPLAGVAAATLAVSLLALGGPTPPATAAGSASFDWSMPDRYAGTDDNGDGRIDTFKPDGPLEITPAGFRVDFVGSGADTCGGANTTVWSIEGIEVTSGDANVVGGDPRSCTFSYQFTREGTYEVTLEGRDANAETAAIATNVVRVQDYLIVSLGDSVASGEGNSEVPGVSPTWQNEQCHRSALAGPARAARALEQADPRTSVTFVHLACSGATINEGLLGPYDGIEPGESLPPQVDQLEDEDLVGDREIDAVLVSIGANDVKFSKIVERCLMQADCDVLSPGSAATLFEQQLAFLPGRYLQLGAALDDAGAERERIYLSEYFDPTRDSAGDVCDGLILGDAGLPPLFSITGAEAFWASTSMMVRLNGSGQTAASDHGWRYVGGIVPAFLPHGYCAADPWVVRLTESLLSQGDKEGTLHPNAPGQAAYAARIGASLTTDLYASGNLQSPRRPLQRLEVQGTLSGDFLDVVEDVERGSTVTVRVRVNGPENAGRSVTLTLQGNGSLSTNAVTTSESGEATLTYTAPDPNLDERARVVATLVDGGRTFRDTVGIEFETEVEVAVAPNSATFAAGEIRQFTASVQNANDPSVTWSASGGTITAGGLYTAGTAPGTYAVTATSVEDPSKSASATVVIVGGGTIFGRYEMPFYPFSFHGITVSGGAAGAEIAMFDGACVVPTDVPDTGGSFWVTGIGGCVLGTEVEVFGDISLSAGGANLQFTIWAPWGTWLHFRGWRCGTEPADPPCH